MKLADALQMVAVSDPGLVRSRNEDAVFVEAALGLAILADGMGGYSAGEVASGMATTLLSSNFSRLVPTCDPAMLASPGAAAQLLGDEILAANSAIFNAAHSQPQYKGMGTTLVFAWFFDNRMLVAHVGDSRLYRLRDGVLMQLTKDHSFLQEQLDSGMITAEEARVSNNRNLVTRALGVEPLVDVEINEYDALPGDLLLLCSDGLSDMVDDATIAATLLALGSDLSLAGTELVHQANERGGRDNISVALIKVMGDFAPPGNWWQKLLAILK